MFAGLNADGDKVRKRTEMRHGNTFLDERYVLQSPSVFYFIGFGNHSVKSECKRNRLKWGSFIDEVPFLSDLYEVLLKDDAAAEKCPDRIKQ